MQLGSPHFSCGVLDPEGDGFSWLPLGDLEFPSNVFGGLSGACRAGERVLLATQSTPPLLVLYDLKAGRVIAKRDLSPCVDPHSLVLDNGTAFTCSTGTNEIYAIDVYGDGLGEPRLHWRYPGLDHDSDLVHLNGLTQTPDGLVATCFGARDATGAWGTAGSIFRVDPFVPLREGLAQPHTPLWDGEQLLFAESVTGRVHVLRRGRDGAWASGNALDVGGYTRGMVRHADALWVGSSAPRRISRSTGMPNRAVEPHVAATLTRVNLSTWTAAEQMSLAGLGEEVYDLVLLQDIPAPRQRTQAIALRFSAIEKALSAAEAEARTAQALLAEAQASLDEADRSLCQERAELSAVKEGLYREQSYAKRLEQELRIVTGSRLWRGAELLRTLAGRTPHRSTVTRLPLPQASATAEGAAPPDNEQLSPPTAPAPKPSVAAVPSETMTRIFRDIFVDNTWGSEISHSGTGSDLTQTAAIREELPQLMRDLNVQSMLDIPCGDFHWMQTLELDIDYTGGDVVPDLIERNNERFGNERRRFISVDVAAGALPRVDLVFCRDLLVHFSFVDALRAIENLKRSGSTYLLTTTFVDRTENSDIETGQWRPLNLRLPPFSLPPPLRIINEGCTEGGGTDWADKSLGLWRLADL